MRVLLLVQTSEREAVLARRGDQPGRMHDYGSHLFHLAAQISPLLFFGPYCLLLGYLILRSTLLPRILGALMALAGVGWLTFVVLAPTNHLIPYLEGLGILAEGLLML